MTQPPTGFCTKCEVVKIIDGDTLRVRITRIIDVRLLECYCPETRTKDLTEKEKGLQAKNYLEDLLYEREDSPQINYQSRPLVLFIPADEDGQIKDIFTFGRVLGRVFVDGEDVSEMMIESGHATKEKQR